MALISIEAVYEGGEIRLLESPPLDGNYRVLITFVAPLAAPAEDTRDERQRAFQATAGTWQDERPIVETIRDIRATRRSRSLPPKL